jgi:hypothetical protein
VADKATDKATMEGPGCVWEVEALAGSLEAVPLETETQTAFPVPPPSRASISVCAGFDLDGVFQRVAIYGQGGKHWGDFLRGEATVRRGSRNNHK